MPTAMIVRSEHFEVRAPVWMDDPSLPEELKAKLRAAGMADPINRVECFKIDDDCFKCGEKLSTPYIYWNGATGHLSLHPQCAAKLSLGLVQDAYLVISGKPSTTEVDAAAWLETFAQKKQYGVEDE